MFVVDLTYLCDLEIVEKHVAEHRRYLDKHYVLGHFLASGPKEPRIGGIILASVDSREKLDAILSEDPFHIHQVARYEVTEFHSIKTAPELSAYKVAVG